MKEGRRRPHHAALACSLLAPDPPRLLSGRIDAGGLERKSCYDGKGPCAFYWNCQKMEASKDKESTIWDIDYPYFEEVRSQYYPKVEAVNSVPISATENSDRPREATRRLIKTATTMDIDTSLVHARQSNRFRILLLRRGSGVGLLQSRRLPPNLPGRIRKFPRLYAVGRRS